jgi:hypothetical protein
LYEKHNYVLKYIQQDATLHSLFYLETALHVSGGTITHHRERKQLCLQQEPPGPVQAYNGIALPLQKLLQNICLCRGYYDKLSLFLNPKQNAATDTIIIIPPKLQVLTCEMVLNLNIKM